MGAVDTSQRDCHPCGMGRNRFTARKRAVTLGRVGRAAPFRRIPALPPGLGPRATVTQGAVGAGSVELLRDDAPVPREGFVAGGRSREVDQAATLASKRGCRMTASR
jgi:hypothetical protein